jgi:hypothetical protein
VGTIGNTSNSYTLWNDSSAEYKRTYRYQAAESGNITSGSLYCSADSGGDASFRIVVYADSSGDVAGRLGYSDIKVVAAGSSKAARSVTFTTPVAVTAGTWYHIGFLNNNTYLNYGRTTGTESYSSYNDNGSWSTPTDPFGTHSAFNTPKLTGCFCTITAANTAPNAPTITSPATGSSFEVTSPLTVNWTFSDDDTGDTQSGYYIRYKITGDAAWTTSALQTSPNGTHGFPGSTFVSGNTYEIQVATLDQAGSLGPYCTSISVTAVAAAWAPTIITPAASATITTAVYSVTWSVGAQTDYQVRRVADDSGSPDTSTVYEDSGETTDSDTRSYDVTFTVDGRTEHVQVRVKVAGVWTVWASAIVTTDFSPPDTPTLALTADSTNGKITVAVTVPSGSGPDATTFDIYRAEESDGTGGIRIYRDGLITTAGGVGTGSYDDYTPAVNIDYYYQAVVKASTGAPASSAWT